MDDGEDGLLEEAAMRPLSSSEDALAAEAPAGGSSPGMLAVGLLLALFTINQWSRQIIYYLVDFKAAPSEEAVRLFMNVGVGFDEAQYGVLASIGFATLFSITSLLAGGVVDRVDPRSLLAGTAAVWSGATIWQGMAQGFPDVLGSRMLSGVGQAFSNPASYTILAKLYPEERRATVNGIYASGLYFGGGLAALSVILDQMFGWRELSMGVGGLGLIAAAITWFGLPPLPPPQADAASSASEAASEAASATAASEAAEALAPGERTALLAEASGAAVGAEEAPGTLALLGQLLSDPTVCLLLLASALRFLAGFTIGVWVVPFYRGAFPTQIGTEFALIKACVNGVAGSVSATGGGLLADRLGAIDKRAGLWVAAAGSVLAVPCWLGTLYSPSLESSLAFLFAEYLLAECWFGPTIAALQSAAPPSAVGLTTGVFSCLTLVGNLAPFLIGIAVKSGGYELPELLGGSVALLYVASAAVFVAAGEQARAATADRESE